MFGRLFAVAALALLGGCAEMSTIYHSRPLHKPQVITIDSYQRNAVFVGSEGMRMCAESAPDTFAAISASLGAEADLKSQSGKLAAALSQSGASIERTQTVNLLRESMYRTCERYLSGAISAETLIVQAARDQRAMVAVLAIEQLTRTARPASTILSAGPTSATVVNGDQVAKMIGEFSDERRTAKDTLDKAKLAYVGSDGAGGSKATGKCDTQTTAPADDNPETSPKLTDWKTCLQDKARFDEAQKVFDAADKRLTQVLTLAGQVNPSSESASTGQGPNNPGGGGTTPSDAAITAVAKAVQKIANAPGIDEALMFCIAYLSMEKRYAEQNGGTGSASPATATATAPSSSPKAVPVSEVQNMCIAIVRERASGDEERVRALFGDRQAALRGAQEARADYQPFRTALIAKIIGTPDDEIAAKLAAFETSARIETGLGTMCGSSKACANLVVQDIYYSEYRKPGSRLAAALEKW